MTYSSFLRNVLVEDGVAQERIDVVPMAPPVKDFMLSDQEKAARNGKTFRLIYAGNMTAHKGLGYLLDAWRKLNLPDAELVLVGSIIGTGRWLDRLAGPNVRHLPRVSRQDLREQFSRSHALVFPTLGDSFGRDVPEAMAAGLPVIATSNCCAPDLIHEGQEGFVVAPADADA